jgi:hypothetical protein
MTIALNGVTVDIGPTSPIASAPRAQAALLSAVGRADPAAAQRLQTPNAVVASTTVPSLLTQAPAPRPLQRAPSSQLAAQFIAQDIGLTASELEIFAVRQSLLPAPSAELPVDDYLTALRIARGDIPAPERSARQNALESAIVSQSKIAAKNNTAAAFTETNLRSGLSARTAGLPALTLPLLRRFNIITLKGVDAYGAALARNATLKAPVD